MSADKMREEFEAWVDSKGLRRTCSGDYHAQGIHLYWLIWQASRAAIEVGVPKITKPIPPNKPSEPAVRRIVNEKVINAKEVRP